MTQPTHIRAEAPAEGADPPHHQAVRLPRARHGQGRAARARRCRPTDRGLTMVFTRTKRTAQKVADDLAERGFAAAAVHGDLGQGAREQALRAFRSGKVDVLVATDVAARGIDVEDVTHVINYQCPEDEKTYVHRIGRTGRAGQDRHRGHAGRLGRHAALEDDQRRARARHPGAGRDLLHLAAPVRRPGHPRGRDRRGCCGLSAPAPVWRPRRSRISARPGAGAGPRVVTVTAVGVAVPGTVVPGTVVPGTVGRGTGTAGRAGAPAPARIMAPAGPARRPRTLRASRTVTRRRSNRPLRGPAPVRATGDGPAAARRKVPTPARRPPPRPLRRSDPPAIGRFSTRPLRGDP